MISLSYAAPPSVSRGRAGGAAISSTSARTWSTQKGAREDSGRRSVYSGDEGDAGGRRSDRGGDRAAAPPSRSRPVVRRGDAQRPLGPGNGVGDARSAQPGAAGLAGPGRS